MRASTWIPWLFFGPLIGALAAKAVFDLTGWGWASYVAQAGLGVLLLVAAAAFVANFRASRSRRKGRKETGSTDHHKP